MLELQDLSVAYGHRTALHEVSLQVSQGEIVTLVGANGAGKSTTLKTISGLIRARGGQISFDGQRIDQLAPHQILERGLAQVPEGRLLFKDMSVWEHLELGAMRASGQGSQFSETLDWVLGLSPILQERREQKAGTLSGGQQQMLAIARGLMSRPRMLMLDEPSLGLAPIVVDTLADIIMQLNAGGMAVLLVEQRVDLALRISSRAYVLETGRVVMQGPSQEIMQNPAIKSAYLGL